MPTNFILKKLFLLSALLIFACSSDDSTSDDDNNNELLNCDGNPIPTIVYGTQEWTVENACHITYRDGTPIPEVTDPNDWGSLTSGAWAYFNNDTAKHRIYNWYAVMGIHDTDPNTPNKEFATEGWHVPTDTEWTTLENHLIASGFNYDGTTTGNKIAKAMASTTGWNNRNETGAPGNAQSLNNDSGFNAFPEGSRRYGAGFADEGLVTTFWTSIEDDANYALSVGLFCNTSNLNWWSRIKHYGYSVRFVKD